MWKLHPISKYLSVPHLQLPSVQQSSYHLDYNSVVLVDLLLVSRLPFYGPTTWGGPYVCYSKSKSRFFSHHILSSHLDIASRLCVHPFLKLISLIKLYTWFNDEGGTESSKNILAYK